MSVNMADPSVTLRKRSMTNACGISKSTVSERSNWEIIVGRREKGGWRRHS